MSATAIESRGLIGNAVAGYHLAWIHRRRLLAVLLPILAPALLGLVLLNSFLGRDQTVIINGALLAHGDNTALAWAKVGLTTVFWLVALPAGSLTVAGALRGLTVRPVKAIVAATLHLPLFAAVLCAVAGMSFLVIKVFVGVAGAVGGPPGFALLIGALVAMAVVVVRLLIGVLAPMLGGSGWGLGRGRVVGTAGAFLLGGVVVPLLLAAARDRVLSTPWPILTEVIDPILLIGVVAVQGGILAHLYLLQDNPVIDARLGPMAGGTPRPLWPAVAAALVPVLLAIGVATANPFGVPSLQSHGDPPAGGAMAVAWPANQHPVMATTTGARFCDNDVCDRFVERNGGPPVMEGWGSAGIGPDGAVVKAAVTGSKEKGGPFIHYARCTRDACREAWLPVRASAKEPFGWPDLAVASAPDGAIWFVLAMPSPEGQAGPPTYRISFIRCAEVPCAEPQRHQAGTLERTPADGYPDNRRARLSIGPDGRPAAVFWIGWTLQTVTCEPVTCAAPRKSTTPAGTPDAVWATPSGPGDAAVSFEPGRLKVGDQWVPLESTAAAAPRSGALAVAGSRIYATVATSTTRPSGFHISFGATDEYWQQDLWICERASCRRRPLDVFKGPAGPEMVAVGPDGQVLIVRADRITLTTFADPRSSPGSAAGGAGQDAVDQVAVDGGPDAGVVHR